MTTPHTSHTVVTQFQLNWVQNTEELPVTHLAPAEKITGTESLAGAIVVLPKLPAEIPPGLDAPALLVVGEEPEVVPDGWNVALSPAPRTTMAEISALFQRAVDVSPGTPTLLGGVAFGTGVSTGNNVTIGGGSRIGANTVIGHDVTIGADCVIHPNVTIMDGSQIGDRVVLFPGVVIGADGFGFAPSPRGAVRIHHVGNVVLGDDVEIGANSCIDRGAFGPTTIGNRTKLDNLCQIGHNVQIGSDCIIAGLAGIGGSTVVGNQVTFGGSVLVTDHVTIGDGATIGGNSAVFKSVPAGEVWAGSPAREVQEFRHRMRMLHRLDEIWERVRHLPESGAKE